MSCRLEMFRAARAYHGALAAYSRAMRDEEGLEEAAQRVIGASLHYRIALERLRAEEPKNDDYRRRFEVARKLLHAASARYNMHMRRRSAARGPWAPGGGRKNRLTRKPQAVDRTLQILLGSRLAVVDDVRAAQDDPHLA